MDDNAFYAEAWSHLPLLPLSDRTTLFLHYAGLFDGLGDARCPVLKLVLGRYSVSSFADILSPFPELEVLVTCDSIDDDQPTFEHGQPIFALLPTSLRHVHILQRSFEGLDCRPVSAATFPALESLTFTWLQPDTGESAGDPAAHTMDPFSNLRNFVEASVAAPLCTFKYLRSTAAEEDALAGAMADLGLVS